MRSSAALRSRYRRVLRSQTRVLASMMRKSARSARKSDCVFSEWSDPSSPSLKCHISLPSTELKGEPHPHHQCVHKNSRHGGWRCLGDRPNCLRPVKGQAPFTVLQLPIMNSSKWIHVTFVLTFPNQQKTVLFEYGIRRITFLIAQKVTNNKFFLFILYLLIERYHYYYSLAVYFLWWVWFLIPTERVSEVLHISSSRCGEFSP